jgi:hypothetical protein
MRTGRESPQVRKTKILGNEKSGFLLDDIPNLPIITTREKLLLQSMGVMTDAI